MSQVSFLAIFPKKMKGFSQQKWNNVDYPEKGMVQPKRKSIDLPAPLSESCTQEGTQEAAQWYNSRTDWCKLLMLAILHQQLHLQKFRNLVVNWYIDWRKMQLTLSTENSSQQMVISRTILETFRISLYSDIFNSTEITWQSLPCMSHMPRVSRNCKSYLI